MRRCFAPAEELEHTRPGAVFLFYLPPMGAESTIHTDILESRGGRGWIASFLTQEEEEEVEPEAAAAGVWQARTKPSPSPPRYGATVAGSSSLAGGSLWASDTPPPTNRTGAARTFHGGLKKEWEWINNEWGRGWNGGEKASSCVLPGTRIRRGTCSSSSSRNSGVHC